MKMLTQQQIVTIQDAVCKLTGAKRRAFQSQVALGYLDGKPRRTEDIFGWSRRTVELRLHEKRTGITCLGRFSDRGNRKTEEKHPQLKQDIFVPARNVFVATTSSCEAISDTSFEAVRVTWPNLKVKPIRSFNRRFNRPA